MHFFCMSQNVQRKKEKLLELGQSDWMRLNTQNMLNDVFLFYIHIKQILSNLNVLLNDLTLRKQILFDF